MKTKVNELVSGIMARKLSRRASAKLMKFIEPAEHMTAYENAIDKSYVKGTLSHHNLAFIIGGFGLMTPKMLHAFNEMFVKNDRIKGMPASQKQELLDLYTEYERILAEDPLSISPKERMMQDAKDYAPALTADEMAFVNRYIDEHEHLPMFYLLTRHYSHSEDKFIKAMCEYLGMFGKKKILDQLSEELHLSKQTVREKVQREISQMEFRQMHEHNWEPYREDFTAQILTVDNIHYETIKEQEHLQITKEDFLNLCRHCLPWADIVEIGWLRRKNGARWVTGIQDVGLFSFDKLYAEIRDAKKDEKRTKPLVIDLSKYCRDKENYMPLSKERIRKAAPTTIMFCKLIVKEVFGIQAQGNKLTIE
jgi:hypothetical protein